MVIDYSIQKTFTQSIDLVDAGNTCIRCKTAELFDYLIFTKTVAGKTSILKVGPVLPDAPVLVPDFSVNLKRVTYNPKKLASEITVYVNDPKKLIIELEEITEVEGYEEIPNIAEAFEECE